MSHSHPPFSYRLPKLRLSVADEISEQDDDSDNNHDMLDDDESVLDHDQAREDALNRALKSSPQGPKPSLPSFKDVLRSLDMPMTTAETRNTDKWKDIVRPNPASTTLLYPKASYMWPPFQAKSRTDASPVLYVDYSPSRRGISDDEEYSEITTRHSHSSQFSRQFDNEFHMTRSSSYSPRHCSTRSPSPSHRANEMSARYYTNRSPSPSESYASSLSADNFDSPRTTQSILEANQHWEDYTRISTATDGKIEYECIWPHPDNPTKSCGFKRKKQGVKRHVEAKHLGIRRHICSYCGQAFSTKLTVDCHIWRKHTGEKPLPCRYGCGKFFNDPARQFRHYESAHGYVSVHPRKKSKVDNP